MNALAIQRSAIRGASHIDAVGSLGHGFAACQPIGMNRSDFAGG
jgi:hypothetical protein